VRDRDASAQSPTSAFLSAKETFQKRQYKGYKNFSKIKNPRPIFYSRQRARGFGREQSILWKLIGLPHSSHLRCF
jgi:hypothetical protein